jgi:hypothetical protein
VIAAIAIVIAAVPAPANPRWTARERGDLLEPWSLEPDLRPVPRPVERPALPTGDEPQAGGADEPTRPAALPEGEGVVVVRCRQIVIGQPARAQKLLELLRAGAQLETAKRSLGGVDVVERTRDYPLEDLEPDIQSEIHGLEEGDWSRVRVQGGRAIAFQLVARERRALESLPALGAGLGPEEQARVQRLQRPRPVARPMVDETRDADAAAVVQQVQPDYPPGTTESGTVTVRVRLGRADDVVAVEIENSSNPIFDEPALRAARRSTYRTSRRDGIPETSVVSVTYNFVAPQVPPGEARQD